MTQSTPIVHDNILFYQQDGQNCTLTVDAPDWYTWLNTANLFVFESGQGSFTARKEQSGNKRGRWYWRAYRKRGGKLYRAYLGHTSALTLTFMHTIATKLTAQHETTLQQSALKRQEDEPLPPGPFSHAPQTPHLYILPVQLSSFVSREQEIAVASQLLLRDDVRLLTFTGPGGVGKTRLALQVAEHIHEHFRAGVCFVPLAPITEAELVMPTIAQTLGVKATHAESQEECLARYLHEKQLLLLLDNFEQVMSVAPRISELLITCPYVKILVTSRAVLHLSGEHEFPVPPLAVPDPQHFAVDTLLSQYSAVALFCLRAQEVKPDFLLTPTNAATIVELCVRLDGLPLALELAASRIKLFPTQALLARLKQGQQLLANTAHSIPTRQQTLQNTIKWSYDLLDDNEQTLFRHLAIFVGGSSLAAAEEICTTLADTNVLAGISSLLDKSLLQQVAQEENEPRIQLLETIREFGLDCLVDAGEAQAAQQAHALYFLNFAEAAEPELYRAIQVHWLDILEREHENIRAALRWFIEFRASEYALRLAVAVARFWAIRGYVNEGHQWLKNILEIAEQSSYATVVQAKALSWIGWLTLLQGNIAIAARHCQKSLKLYQSQHDTHGIALVLHRLGLIKLHQGHFDEAYALLQESVKQYKVLADHSGMAYSLMALGKLTTGHNDPGEAHTWLEESLSLFKLLNNQEGMAWALSGLAQHYFLQSDWEHAFALSQETLTLFRTMRLDEGVGSALLLQGQIQLRQGAAASAQSLFSESIHYFQIIGSRLNIANALFYLACAAVSQGKHTNAHNCWQESIAIYQELHAIHSIITALEMLAATAIQQKEAQWAIHLLGAADALRETASLTSVSLQNFEYERTIAALHTQFDAATFTMLWTQGRALTPTQAFVVREEKLALVTLKHADELSPREIEVLRLLARGLTNAQIAEQLVISPRTVNAHLRSIYNKIMVTSRSAATRYALEHNIA